jgi:hypothetical protein
LVDDLSVDGISYQPRTKRLKVMSWLMFRARWYFRRVVLMATQALEWRKSWLALMRSFHM